MFHENDDMKDTLAKYNCSSGKSQPFFQNYFPKSKRSFITVLKAGKKFVIPVAAVYII